MKLPCQVCGRLLTAQRDGLVKRHKPPHCHGREADNCRGVGYRHARWSVGQRLRHHSGAEWVILADIGGAYGDYELRCVSTARALSDEEIHRQITAHGEYMHRHGWVAIEDDCMCGCGFDDHDHRLAPAPCRNCEEPYECPGYELDSAAA